MIRSIAVFLNKLGHGINDMVMPQFNFIYAQMLSAFGGDKDALIKYSIGFGVLVLLFGCLLGFKRKISVYSNVSDVSATFLAVVFPFVGFFFAAWVGTHAGSRAVFIISKWVMYSAEAVFVATIVYSTWKSNRSVWKFILALYTKVAMASLLVINLFMLFSALNSNKRKYEAGTAPLIDGSVLRPLLMSGIIAGIIYGLIDTEGQKGYVAAKGKETDDEVLRRVMDASLAKLTPEQHAEFERKQAYLNYKDAA